MTHQTTTGMCIVNLGALDDDGEALASVMHLDTILRAAHLQRQIT
jgi:hypothetical protein